MSIRDDYVKLCIEHGWNEAGWGDQSPNDHFADPSNIDNEPVVLIERSKYGQLWITLHETVQEAADANINQEYAEDWLDPTIIDLRDGLTYWVEYRAVAVLAPREET